MKNANTLFAVSVLLFGMLSVGTIVSSHSKIAKLREQKTEGIQLAFEYGVLSAAWIYEAEGTNEVSLAEFEQKVLEHAKQSNPSLAKYLTNFSFSK